MRALDYLRARSMQALAPLTVRYGEELRGSGGDLPPPRRITVPTRHGRVPAHLYQSDRHESVFVHFHGGAFLMRYPQMDDFWCRHLVAETGLSVLNVDFRVGPQVRYPVAQEECHDAAAWAAGRYDGVAVGGFSSGGGLAAATCLMARDAGTLAPRLQVLGVPALDMTTEPRDGDPGMISPDLRRLVRRVYFPDAARRAEPYASPLRAADLTGLPPAVVMTAERDVLGPEGDAYARRLREAGVPVVHDVTPGADHYFLSADLARAPRTMALVVAEIRRRFTSGS